MGPTNISTHNTFKDMEWIEIEIFSTKSTKYEVSYGIGKVFQSRVNKLKKTTYVKLFSKELQLDYCACSSLI